MGIDAEQSMVQQRVPILNVHKEGVYKKNRSSCNRQKIPQTQRRRRRCCVSSRPNLMELFSVLVLSCSCSSFFFSKEKEKEQQEEITKTIEEEEEEETLVLVVTAESVLRIVARSACHRFTRPLVSNQRGVNSEPVSKSRSCVNPLPESLTFSAAVIQASTATSRDGILFRSRFLRLHPFHLLLLLFILLFFHTVE